MSLWGARLGVVLALGLGALVDSRTLRDGQQLFLFSPRLLGFTLALRAAAGRARRRLRDPPHRAAVARRGDPPRSVSARMVSARAGSSKAYPRARGPRPCACSRRGPRGGVGRARSPWSATSGSGKSTLLNLLGLLEPPDAGEIWFDGDAREPSLAAAPSAACAACRSATCSSRSCSSPRLTALENVLLAARYVGRDRAAAPARGAEALMERLGVAHRRRALPRPALRRRAAAGGLLSRRAQPLRRSPMSLTGNLDDNHARVILDELSRRPGSAHGGPRDPPPGRRGGATSASGRGPSPAREP